MRDLFRLHGGVLASVFLFSIAGHAAEMQLQPVVSHGLNKPVYATTAPGEGEKLYVVEQAGRILTLENGKLGAKPFLDIRSKVISGGETPPQKR